MDEDECGMYQQEQLGDDDLDEFIPPEELTDSQREQIRELYQRFDVDKSGSLSSRELRKGLQVMGLNPTEKDTKAIIRKYVGKKVTYEVWESIFKEEILKRTNQEFDLLQAFKIFDVNDDGTLDRCELKRCLTVLGEQLTDEECDELFDQLDTNKDGTLSYLEASKLLA